MFWKLTSIYLLLILLSIPCFADEYILYPESTAIGYFYKYYYGDSCTESQILGYSRDEGDCFIEVGIWNFRDTPPDGWWGTDDGFISINTSSLVGKSLSSTIFKIGVYDTISAGKYKPDLWIKFAQDCIHDTLVIADTSCFCLGGCTPDTIIAFDSIVPGDTLAIRIPTDKINLYGRTDIIFRSAYTGSFCSEDSEALSMVLLYATPRYPEICGEEGMTDEPYLYLEALTSEESKCSCCNGD